MFKYLIQLLLNSNKSVYESLELKNKIKLEKDD